MRSYHHFSESERLCLQIMWMRGDGVRAIAAVLGRSP
ncbi:MAG: helix-turn-helix domain-containing protein, partial [Spirochaetaceae bacterium]|nr:helix-turn-helix domain-containing protein [Spirochaetaceae bacterium]